VCHSDGEAASGPASVDDDQVASLACDKECSADDAHPKEEDDKSSAENGWGMDIDDIDAELDLALERNIVRGFRFSHFMTIWN
jgi:hypothetical protein